MTLDRNAEIRLSKWMAEQGWCSRREADEYIRLGWVSVDGQTADVLGTKIRPGQRVTLDPRARRLQNRRVTILVNKPSGYVSGQPEKGYPPAVTLIRPETRFAGDRSGRRFDPVHLQGLAPAGRLDIDSQGLLVFTQDGRIAKQLVGAHGEVEKEYWVRVEGELAPEKLAQLRHGLALDGRVLRPAIVTRMGPGRLRFILREGRKRQIRRMCELVGLRVTSLARARIGRVRLADLPPGQWRYLGEDESF